MVMRPLSDVLRSRMAELTPQERRVARVVLADYPRAGLGSAQGLATAAGVSSATVIRFAQTLGFSGLTDLHQVLLAEVSERAASPITQQAKIRTASAESGSSDHWSSRGLAVALEAISESFRALPVGEIDRAVDLLADPRLTVTAFGGRYSHALARYMTQHLRQMRPRILPQELAPHIDPADVIDAGKRRVAVIYDFRRYQRSTILTATQLAKAGTTIICITDPWTSPVANVADVVLPLSVDSDSPYDSATPALVMTELLIGGVLNRLHDTAPTRMRTWEELARHEVLNDFPNHHDSSHPSPNN